MNVMKPSNIQEMNQRIHAVITSVDQCLCCKDFYVGSGGGGRLESHPVRVRFYRCNVASRGH